MYTLWNITVGAHSVHKLTRWLNGLAEKPRFYINLCERAS